MKNQYAELLTPAQTQQIHEVSLEILGQVGARVQNEEARHVSHQVPEDHGCGIDRGTGIVGMPGRIVEQYLQTIPVFLQLHHLSVDRVDAEAAPEFRAWCEQSIAAGFRQVEFDASAFCEGGGTLPVQVTCAQATATAARFHSNLHTFPDAVYEGEVGEIGGAITTIDDLREFMAAYWGAPGNPPPLGKISVNTGTTHGGIIDTSTGFPFLEL